jgi:4-methylaminobutanoate oxidase (formaldehyde-forming)
LARIETDAYYIVTGTGFATHDLAWIGDHIPENMDARLVDVTSARAVLSLMGPKAREVLAAVTDADVSSTAFPFGTVREIAIGGAPVRALRITYVGELGWELHIPSECAGAVYDRLLEAGRPLGLVNAGYRAIESLRLEKGYRAWGSDIGPDHTPLEAGLSWAVKLRGNRPFLGREALDAQTRTPLTKRLAGFTVDHPDIVLLGRETIFRDGRQAGWLTSGGWGYTVGKSIGYGYVRNPDGVTTEYLTSGNYELEVACERVPAQLHLQPLYDPKNERVRG